MRPKSLLLYQDGAINFTTMVWSRLQLSPGYFIGYRHGKKKQTAIVREVLPSGELRISPLDKTANRDIYTFLVLREIVVSPQQIFAVGDVWRNNPVMFKIDTPQQERRSGGPLLPRLRPGNFVIVNETEMALLLSHLFHIQTDEEFTYDGISIPKYTECFAAHFLKKNKSCPGWYYYRLDCDTNVIPVTSITSTALKMFFCDQMDSSMTKVTMFPEIEVDVRDFVITPLEDTNVNRTEPQQPTGLSPVSVTAVPEGPSTSASKRKASSDFLEFRKDIFKIYDKQTCRECVCKNTVESFPPHSAYHHAKLEDLFGSDGSTIIEDQEEKIIQILPRTIPTDKDRPCVVSWTPRGPVQVQESWILWYFPKLVSVVVNNPDFDKEIPRECRTFITKQQRTV